MIRTKHGRSASKRTKAELEVLLQKEMQGLTLEEREAVQIVLNELANKQQQPQGPMLLDVLSRAEYRRVPVDMETFIKDPYYLGGTCDNIYPVLLKDLKELFSGGYHEAIFTGSIGWGKTHIASIGVCRVLYELSCMKDPQTSYGLSRGSNISFVCFSVNENLAIKVVFEAIAAKIKASPYFQENFPFEDTKKELRFPNLIRVAAHASNDTSALGLNVIGGLMDESNFLQKTLKDQNSGVLDRAETIYNTIQRRMKSRFEKNGKLPGMLFIVSSKKTMDDFTAKRIRESKEDPTVFVRDYALWDTKPQNFSQQKFTVLCGNEHIPSKILTDAEILEFRSKPPEDVTLIEVPTDFRSDFDRDLEGAIRDIAGVATVAINPFIHRREKIDEAIDRNRVHPFTNLVYDPSKGGSFRWDIMTAPIFERGYGNAPVQVMRPKINPRAPRHVHIDPSLRGDSTGLAMVHVGGFRQVVRRTEDGHEYLERAPVFVVDLLLRIVPPVGNEIVLGEVRHLVYDLSAHGYMITGVTMDSWQSADSIQQFNQRGFNSLVLSVDTTNDPYETLKMALYENRVSYYEYPPLIDELRQLERHYDGKKAKIDHPSKGSKDVADALAAACFALSLNSAVQPLPIIKGLSYSGDAWLEEQRQSVFAGNVSSAVNTDLDLLPPFLVGGGGHDGGYGNSGGGGWYPG